MKYQLTNTMFCWALIALAMLLPAHPTTASKYLRDVPEDVRQPILQWEAKLGKRADVDGTVMLTKPYHEETFNMLIEGLKHPHPAARSIASQLLYWSVRDLAVPEGAIERLKIALEATRSVAREQAKVENPEFVEPDWTEYIDWIIAYKKLDETQQLARLKEVLFGHGVRNWRFAQDGVGLLVRLGTDEAKAILLSRLERENSGSTFRKLLQLALERIEISRKLDKVPDAVQQVAAIAEMLRQLRPAPGTDILKTYNTWENSLSFYLIQKLESLRIREAEDVLWAILGDKSYALQVRSMAEEAATGVPIARQTGYLPKRPPRQ